MMPTDMLARIAAGALCLVSLAAPAFAREPVSRDARAWVANVVERVQGTAALVAAPTAARKGRVFGIHLRIATDGSVQDISFDSPLPSGVLGRRLEAAIVAASPFDPPPVELLTLDGATSLDFPLTVTSVR